MYEYKEELIKDSTMTYTSLKLDKENNRIRKDYIKLMKSFDISLDILIMPTKEFNKKMSKLKYKIEKKELKKSIPMYSHIFFATQV